MKKHFTAQDLTELQPVSVQVIGWLFYCL